MKRTCTSLAILFTLFACGATAAWAGNAKVQVCHIPPGNPGNFHTITISENALQAHLGHGDLAGPCSAHCSQLCDDGSACTIDACDANERCLITHPPVNCDDSNPCTLDSCDPPIGCQNTPKTCIDNNLCTIDACDPLTGSCVFPAVSCPAGQACNASNGNCQPPQVTCPCNDPAVSPSFAAIVAGQSPIDVCLTAPFFFPTEGVVIGQFRAGSGVVEGQWVCGPAAPDGLMPISQAQGQFCASLLVQAAANQGLTCGPPPN